MTSHPWRRCLASVRWSVNKCDRQGPRTPADLERKWNFAKMAKAADIADDAKHTAEAAAKTASDTAKRVDSPEFKQELVTAVIEALPRYEGEVEPL